MNKVAIVTDSTAYIPPHIVANLPVHIVPLQVIWDMEIYQDGIDIKPDEFYQKLVKSKSIPTTSQPSPARFANVYQKLLNEGFDIITILISSELSGTVASALQARDHFPYASIEVIDSRTTSMAMGFPVIKTATAAMSGLGFEECNKIARDSIKNSGIFFAVNTLEFLHRGGRIGGGAAFLGTLLDLKPILEVRNGKIEAIEKVRSINKAGQRLLEIVEKQINGNSDYQMAVIHADITEEARQFQEMLANHFGIPDTEDILCVDASPVIGTHTGPGTIGIAFNY